VLSYRYGGTLGTIGLAMGVVGLLGVLWMMVIQAMQYDAQRRKSRTPPGNRKP